MSEEERTVSEKIRQEVEKINEILDPKHIQRIDGRTNEIHFLNVKLKEDGKNIGKVQTIEGKENVLSFHKRGFKVERRSGVLLTPERIPVCVDAIPGLKIAPDGTFSQEENGSKEPISDKEVASVAKSYWYSSDACKREESGGITPVEDNSLRREAEASVLEGKLLSMGFDGLKNQESEIERDMEQGKHGRE